MSISNNILELSKHFRLFISHAKYKWFDYPGSNTLPVNRIWAVEEVKASGGCYIENHSSQPVQRLYLQPGRIYFMPGNQTLKYDFHPGVKLIAFHFNIEIFPGIDLFDNETSFMELPDSMNLIARTKEFWNKDDDLGNTVILYGLFYMLAGMFSNKSLNDIAKSYHKRRQFTKLLEHIEANCNAMTTVSELAELQHMTCSAFSKAFIRSLGIAPKHYMTRLLLNKATSQLLLSDLKIKEVSEILGFNNEYYFCKFFKKHTGMTPQAYRNYIR